MGRGKRHQPAPGLEGSGSPGLVWAELNDGLEDTLEDVVENLNSRYTYET